VRVALVRWVQLVAVVGWWLRVDAEHEAGFGEAHDAKAPRLRPSVLLFFDVAEPAFDAVARVLGVDQVRVPSSGLGGLCCRCRLEGDGAFGAAGGGCSVGGFSTRDASWLVMEAVTRGQRTLPARAGHS